VFPIYAVPIGLLAGWLIGGRLEGLADVRFRWAALALGGLGAQIVLFSGVVDGLAGDRAELLYVVSTVVVLVAVVRNIAIPGLALVALGALLNLAAILANGGSMPSTPGAYALAGIEPDDSLTNSVLVENPALQPLTDVYALPAALPFSNVFSIGDVLIGVGLAATIALAMRRGRIGRVAGAGGSGVDAGVVRAGNSPD
jgi:hypothetical protein